jgi:hypothetical protein
MLLHCCCLLAAWAALTNALSMVYPPANCTLALGSMFLLTWVTNQTVSPTLLVTVSLLSSPSTSDVLSVLATTTEESDSQMIIINHAQSDTAYYLSLNDSSSPTVVAGPYYFTNSTISTCEISTAGSSPQTAPSSTEFGPMLSAPFINNRFFPLAIILGVISFSLIVAYIWLVRFVFNRFQSS